jgi:hypothetical protein
VPRALGGTHDVENLLLLCDGCHAAHHRGLILISGTASELLVRRKYEIAYDQPANDEVESIEASSSSVDVKRSAHAGNAAIEHETSTIDVEVVTADAGNAAIEPEARTVDVEVVSAHAGNAAIELGTRTVDVDALSSRAGNTAKTQAESWSVGDERGSRAAVCPPATDERGQCSTEAETAHPGRFELERMRIQARLALTTLGYRAGTAGKAVDVALRSGNRTLEAVIREALRSCSRVT